MAGTNPSFCWLAFQFAFGTREAFNNEEFRNAEMLGTDWFQRSEAVFVDGIFMRIPSAGWPGIAQETAIAEIALRRSVRQIPPDGAPADSRT